LFSYGGLLFDLLVVPFLLFRHTRPLALLAAVGFHLMNSQLFTIGIFPP
jgi:vitamin K-dependent gamma-carboxylase